jgi:hypothetical protein
MSKTGLRVIIPPKWNPEQVIKRLDIPETLYRTLGFEESQPYRFARESREVCSVIV